MFDGWLAKDKRAHMGAYFGLGIFLGFYFPTIWCLLFMLTLSVVWEYTWKFVKNEQVDPGDIYASLAGGIVGLLIIKSL